MAGQSGEGVTRSIALTWARATDNQSRMAFGRDTLKANKHFSIKGSVGPRVP
jgi:hypothetical protein